MGLRERGIVRELIGFYNRLHMDDYAFPEGAALGKMPALTGDHEAVSSQNLAPAPPG